MNEKEKKWQKSTNRITPKQNQSFFVYRIQSKIKRTTDKEI